VTKLNLEIDDEFIDGLSISRNAKAADGGKWEVFVCHRIGSVKDNYGRAIGRYTSGKAVEPSLEEAFLRANNALNRNVRERIAEQNASPPQPSKGLSSEEAALFKLLDLG
jgi:hypothetical protein